MLFPAAFCLFGVNVILRASARRPVGVPDGFEWLPVTCVTRCECVLQQDELPSAKPMQCMRYQAARWVISSPGCTPVPVTGFIPSVPRFVLAVNRGPAQVHSPNVYAWQLMIWSEVRAA